jgi:hypothetical protein
MASFGSTSESCGGAFDTAGGMFGVIDDDAKCTGGGQTDSEWKSPGMFETHCLLGAQQTSFESTTPQRTRPESKAEAGCR